MRIWRRAFSLSHMTILSSSSSYSEWPKYIYNWRFCEYCRRYISLRCILTWRTKGGIGAWRFLYAHVFLPPLFAWYSSWVPHSYFYLYVVLYAKPQWYWSSTWHEVYVVKAWVEFIFCFLMFLPCSFFSQLSTRKLGHDRHNQGNDTMWPHIIFHVWH